MGISATPPSSICLPLPQAAWNLPVPRRLALAWIESTSRHTAISLTNAVTLHPIAGQHPVSRLLQ